MLRFGSAEGRGAAGAPVQRGAGAGGVAARGPAENQQKCSHFQVQSGAEWCREEQRGAEVQRFRCRGRCRGAPDVQRSFRSGTDKAERCSGDEMQMMC